MPNCCQNGNGWRSQVLPGGAPAIQNTDFARSLGDRGSPIASNRPVRRTRKGILRANVRAGRSPGSPGALPIECAPKGRFLAHRIDRCGAHARVSCAWKSSFQKISPGISPSKKISPEISPVRTFKKPCIFKGLREISPISPISPGCRGCRGCVVSCVRPHAREVRGVPMRAKAHLVTICHQPFEWPFFRVLGG